MARTASETSTKTATRRANTKPKANGKETKRAPSAYNLFVKEHMKTYLTDNPGKTNKDAMKHIGALWRNAPENPKRGQEAKEKTPKASKRSKKAAANDSAKGPEVELGSDE